MISLYSYVAPPSSCGYVPQELWSLQYEHCLELSAAEYMDRLRQGWRRFGHVLFRPHCSECDKCRSLRVVVDEFTPNRSQRRVRKLNAGDIRLVIGPPDVSRAKLRLYDRYHAFQSELKNWPLHAPKDAASFGESFVENPFPTEEWCYYLGSNLVGVGYVDVLPAGASGIYFFYDPDLRDRQLGTWNVLNLIEQSRVRNLPHLYLGYFVDGCRSLEYKATYRPNETLMPDGAWRRFREE